MDPADLVVQCMQQMALGAEHTNLVIPRGWKAPKGFPRGYLCCEKPNGDRVREYSIDRLMRWLTGPCGVAITSTPEGYVVDSGQKRVRVTLAVVGKETNP